MSTCMIPEQNLKTKQVKVTYKVKTFYAHCPGCGRARSCRHENDGSFSLICGCRRDGANKIEYLIDAEEILTRDEVRTKYLDVPDDYLSGTMEE